MKQQGILMAVLALIYAGIGSGAAVAHADWRLTHCLQDGPQLAWSDVRAGLIWPALAGVRLGHADEREACPRVGQR